MKRVLLVIAAIALLVSIIIFGWVAWTQFQQSDSLAKQNNQRQNEIESIQNTLNKVIDSLNNIKSDSVLIPSNNQTTPPPKNASRIVQVYFARSPESQDDFSKVFPVNRITSREDVSTYVIEEIIEGPTSQEQQNNYYTPLILSGESVCQGQDFKLSVRDRVATLLFCKQIVSNGVGDDARIVNSINSSLKQFNTVDRVVILNQNNSCFGDLSGQDKCKI